MESINWINEVSHPAMIFLPIILMSISGYSVGRIFSRLRRTDSTLTDDILYGNLILNFVFITGFIITALFFHGARLYFQGFTICLIVLTLLTPILLPYRKQIMQSMKQEVLASKLHILFAMGLVVGAIALHGYLIFYHPIFSEYDAMYDMLLNSKSILLGDGLGYDYYRDSDITIRSPPYMIAIDAWLIDIFGYSSLRLFPVYFIIMLSLAVFAFARRVTNNAFASIIAAIAFLIFPATLVVSSRFSMYRDFALTFSIILSLYLLLQVCVSKRLDRWTVLMLITSLSFAIFIQELGIILAVSLFFMFLSLRFAGSAAWLRILFTFLSLLPLYFLTAYDMLFHGFTFVVSARLALLLLSNLVLIYLSHYSKMQEPTRALLRYVPCLMPAVIPLVLISLNIADFGGPYPGLIFSESFGESLSSYRDVFDITNKLDISWNEALQRFLRFDVLLTGVALGSIFIFFKILGFRELILNFKANDEYKIVLLGLIIVVAIWSYLDLGFVGSDIRHVFYFGPLLAIILVLGFGGRKSWSNSLVSDGRNLFRHLYLLSLVTFASYYFISFSLFSWSYHDHFGGFWLEPNRSTFLTPLDVVVAAGLIAPLVILRIIGNKVKMQTIERRFLGLAPLGFAILLTLNFVIFSTNNIVSTPFETLDTVPPSEWESNVFQVVDYLEDGGQGKIVSVRAPALSFFTNRTNLDLYNVHSFSKAFPLLNASTPTQFRDKMSELGIAYVVVPSEASTLNSITENLDKKTSFIQHLNSDENIIKVGLKSFDIYLYNPDSLSDLMDERREWRGVLDAVVLQNSGNVTVSVNTTRNEEVFNRGVLDTEIRQDGKPIIISFDYSSKSTSGSAKFASEIRDSNTSDVLWSALLDKSSGEMKKAVYDLPRNLPERVELRLYVITTEPGEHVLFVKNLRISYK